MKRALWFVVVIVALATVGAGLLALNRGPEWTTTSPAALAELEAGLQAKMKVYHAEAVAHFEKALELDPDFVAAKLLLVETAGMLDSDRKQDLWAELESAELDRLQPREQLFIRRALALRNKRTDSAMDLVDEYLIEYPNDPFALNLKAGTAWRDGEFAKAERLYQQLLKISPNWVVAYNSLGYITMLQGRFVEAEEHFTSYRFIAPDQANPHDSLGELYIVRGRWDEAVASLEKAIRIKPQFVPSYEHLILVHLLREDLAEARRVLADLAAIDNPPSNAVTAIECALDYADLHQAQAWQEILERQKSQCYQEAFFSSLVVELTHSAACHLGEYDVALQIEKRIKEKTERSEMAKVEDQMGPVLSHYQGVRLAFQGDLDEAAARFEAADKQLNYIGANVGSFKLVNRLSLVEAYRAMGHDIEAHRLLDKVRFVNPALAAQFQDKGMRLLGLTR